MNKFGSVHAFIPVIPFSCH